MSSSASHHPSIRSRDSHHGPFFSTLFAATAPETRVRAQIFALVAGAALLLYLFLLPPSVARGGDSGELISASYHLGIAHPSGYAVWCLLARLFAALPVGEVAWRYNLFSALCGALAAAVMAVTAHRCLASTQAKRAQIASIGAGLLLAGFFFFGSQAIIAEVYALAALEGAVLIYLALKWKQDGDWRDFYLFAFLAGLSPLIHLSGIFLWPILGVWMLWKTKISAPKLGIAVAFFLIGLVPLLYFPIRSAAFSSPPLASLDNYFYFPLDWGHPASFSALKNHLSAAQYSGLLQPKSAPELWENGLHLLGFLVIQYLWATPLLLWGAIAAFKHRIGAVLLLIWVFNVGVEIQYDVGDQSNFFFPAYLVMSLWMALGWFEWFGWLRNRGEKLTRGAQNSLWPWRMQTLGALILVATIAAQWSLFAAGASQRGATRPRDGALEAARAAQTLAKREGKVVAALYVHDDTLWPFWYAKYALGAAPDVETPWGRGLTRVQESGKMADYVAQLKRSGPVVLAQWDEKTDARFPLVMLTPSGNLCVASDEKLPPAATPLSIPAKNPTTGPNGLIAARFRRAKLWQSRGDVPAFSPSSLAAFEVDFRTSAASPRFIEILIAKNGAINGLPKPDQQSATEGRGETARILISRQKRRLILPSSTAKNEVFRAAVPLQIEASSPLGAYTVWTRLVASTAEKTPWTRSDALELTSK